MFESHEMLSDRTLGQILTPLGASVAYLFTPEPYAPRKISNMNPKHHPVMLEQCPY